MLTDLDIRLILDEEDEVPPPEDPRLILPKRREGRTRGGFNFNKGEIVWMIKVLHNDGKERVVNEKDMERSADDFRSSQEELSCSLLVVSHGRAKLGSIKAAKVESISDGQVFSETSVVPYKFLHPFDSTYRKTEAIKDAFARSISWKNKKSEYQEMHKTLEMQLESVKRFIRECAVTNKLSTYKYLVKKEAPSETTRKKLSDNTSFNLSGNEVKEIVVIDPPKKNLKRKSSERNIVQDSNNDTDSAEGEFEEEDDRYSEKQNKIMREMAKDLLRIPKPFDEPTPRNLDITAFFEKENVHEYLKKIMLGKIASKRHQMMTCSKTNHVHVDSPLLFMGNPTFLDDDNEITNTRLVEILTDKVFDQCCHELNQDLCKNIYFRNEYIWSCLIPEGIVYYLKRKHHIGTDKAENIFWGKFKKRGFSRTSRT